jgi:anti-sigma factor RsiW
MSTSDRHLSNEEIIRWVEESDPPRDAAAVHLDRCESCRARVAGVEALLSALRAEPPAASATEMAAQRERILAAVRSRPRARVRRLPRRAVWLPAAAAAVAALLLWAPRGTRSPGPAPDAEADSATLPVVFDATRAAEEVVEAADDPDAAERLLQTPSLDPVDPDVAATISDDWSETLEIEAEFAGLSAADREAILTELASVNFMNDPEE